MNLVVCRTGALDCPSLPASLSIQVGALATAALIDEPRVWPRFGLVGPDEPGAHRDMTYTDLVHSARVLEPFFAESARLGLTLSAAAPEAARIWRFTGLDAETRMYRATGGINTHKGAIFLLGLLAFSWGRAVQCIVRRHRSCPPVIDSRLVLEIAHRAIAPSLHEEQRAHCARWSETYGQWAYRRFAWGGIRRTVIENFQGLRRALRSRPSLSALSGPWQLAVARHHLFIDAQDSNLLKRAGWRATQRLLHQARYAARVGGVYTRSGRRWLDRLDTEMAECGWSASGSGDLLAAFLFLDGLESGTLATRRRTRLAEATT